MNHNLLNNVIHKIESLFVHQHTSLILEFLIGVDKDLKSAIGVLKTELDEIEKKPPKKGRDILLANVSRAILNLLSKPEQISRGEAEDDLTALLQAFIALSADVDYQLGVELLSSSQIHQLNTKEDKIFWLTSRMGFALLKSDKSEPALELLRLSVEIGKKTDIDANKLAEVLNNFAIAARKQQNISEAEEAYKEAIKIRQILSDTNLDEKNRLARLLNNLAALYSDTDRIEDAEMALSQALSLRRELAQTDSFYTEHYTQTLENMLVLLNQKGDLEKALAYEKELVKVKNEIQKNLEKKK